jgi:hypothetical protein
MVDSSLEAYDTRSTGDSKAGNTSREVNCWTVRLTLLRGVTACDALKLWADSLTPLCCFCGGCEWTPLAPDPPPD